MTEKPKCDEPLHVRNEGCLFLAWLLLMAVLIGYTIAHLSVHWVP